MSGVFIPTNIIPRKQVGKMASGMSYGFQIDSDQAVYNS